MGSTSAASQTDHSPSLKAWQAPSISWPTCWSLRSRRSLLSSLAEIPAVSWCAFCCDSSSKLNGLVFSLPLSVEHRRIKIPEMHEHMTKWSCHADCIGSRQITETEWYCVPCVRVQCSCRLGRQLVNSTPLNSLSVPPAELSSRSTNRTFPTCHYYFVYI